MSPHSEALDDLLARPPMPSIVAAAGEHAGTVLCVGGAVRDALLGRRPGDIDIAVGGELADFVDAFARHCGRRPVAIGDPWRDTHRTVVDGAQVDIGSMLGDETEDLARRDFSINAMAVNLSASRSGAPALIDEHGGVEDLGRRTIRMLSVDALIEDPLRMLRAIRYVATLEGFGVDPATEAAIAIHAGTIRDIAAERVQTEWALLLEAPSWVDAVELSLTLGLDLPTMGAPANLRDARAWSSFERAESVGDSAAYDVVVLRLAALLFADGSESPAEVQRRLGERRWPATLARRAARVGAWARMLPGAGTSDLVDWALEDEADAGHAALLAKALRTIDASVGDEASIDALDAFARRAGEPRWVRGADLRGWGVVPGPELGELLHRMARGQLERRWESAAAARDWAVRHLAGRGAQADE